MPKISKTTSKKPKTKSKKADTIVKKKVAVEKKIKAAIKISKTYVPKDTEKYMFEKDVSYFKRNDKCNKRRQ